MHLKTIYRKLCVGMLYILCSVCCIQAASTEPTLREDEIKRGALQLFDDQLKDENGISKAQKQFLRARFLELNEKTPVKTPGFSFSISGIILGLFTGGIVWKAVRYFLSWSGLYSGIVFVVSSGTTYLVCWWFAVDARFISNNEETLIALRFKHIFELMFEETTNNNLSI